MDRNVLPWGCFDSYPRKTRVRRGKVVIIPERWRGKEPQYPGTLQERHEERAAKKVKRRSDKLRQRQETR